MESRSSLSVCRCVRLGVSRAGQRHNCQHRSCGVGPDCCAGPDTLLVVAMTIKKKPKEDTSRKLLIERLEPEEALRVLQRLLAAHPELAMEAEGIAKALLRAAD